MLRTIGIVTLTLVLAGCGGSSAPAATRSVDVAVSTSTPVPAASSAPVATPIPTVSAGVYLAPGATIPAGRTPPPIDVAKGTLISSGDGKIVQIVVRSATFLPVGPPITFTITSQTLMTLRKPNQATQVNTLSETGVKDGDPVSVIYETMRSADGTYHLRSIRYDE